MVHGDNYWIPTLTKIPTGGKASGRVGIFSDLETVNYQKQAAQTRKHFPVPTQAVVNKEVGSTSATALQQSIAYQKRLRRDAKSNASRDASKEDKYLAIMKDLRTVGYV
jgi:hypothetical protein